MTNLGQRRAEQAENHSPAPSQGAPTPQNTSRILGVILCALAALLITVGVLRVTGDEYRYSVTQYEECIEGQAAKKARSYLSSGSAWTRSRLIDQLEYEGFSYDEARYGVENCGEDW